MAYTISWEELMTWEICKSVYAKGPPDVRGWWVKFYELTWSLTPRQTITSAHVFNHYSLLC